jgi:hypothetical protein
VGKNEKTTRREKADAKERYCKDKNKKGRNRTGLSKLKPLVT